jgi:Ribonucleotide reductase, barrel domain
MLSDIQLTSVQIASSSEPTPELVSFWQQKYRELYLSKLFFLDQATEDLISLGTAIKEFRPPRGYLNLEEHIKDGRLDGEQMQKTVEIAVRYLDDLLDTLQYKDRAEKIASNYRAIKLSIQNFELYLDKINPLNNESEIDKIASIITTSAYRASESLAEEKGACGAWSKYSKPPKLKSFDLLYNTSTDEEMLFGDFDNQHLVLEGSEWEVYQRRNLTILDLPKNSSWSKWDDYKETKPESQIVRVPTKAVEVTTNTDSIQSMSQALNSSPYRKLFSSLLGPSEEIQSPKPITTEPPVEIQEAVAEPIQQSIPEPLLEKKTILASSIAPKPNDSRVNIQVSFIVLFAAHSMQAGLLHIETNSLSDTLHTQLIDTSKSELLHAFHDETGMNLVYQTELANMASAPKITFLPFSQLKLGELNIQQLLEKHQSKIMEVAKQLVVATSPSASEVGEIRYTLGNNTYPQHSHMEEFKLNTSYFGRVLFTAEYINGQLSSVSGFLERHQEMNDQVFGFINDTLRFITLEGVLMSEILQNLEVKKRHMQSTTMLKPLILSTHILKIASSKHIG